MPKHREPHPVVNLAGDTRKLLQDHRAEQLAVKQRADQASLEEERQVQRLESEAIAEVRSGRGRQVKSIRLSTDGVHYYTVDLVAVVFRISFAQGQEYQLTFVIAQPLPGSPLGFTAQDGYLGKAIGDNAAVRIAAATLAAEKRLLSAGFVSQS